MARGGCSSCFTGGSGSLPGMLYIILTLGVFLIVMGIVIHNKDILDISINPVSRNTLNNYIGYGAILIGVILIFVAAMTMNQMV